MLLTLLLLSLLPLVVMMLEVVDVMLMTLIAPIYDGHSDGCDVFDSNNTYK